MTGTGKRGLLEPVGTVVPGGRVHFPLDLGMINRMGGDPRPDRVRRVPAWYAVHLARRVARCPRAGSLDFREVSTEDDWERVRSLRCRVYEQQADYMRHELDVDGGDELDGNCVVFLATWQGVAVGTARLAARRFETERFLDPQELESILGAGWRQRYLEWTRLVVDRNQPVRRLGAALIAYAQLRIVTETGYRRYFGYSRVALRKYFLSNGFVLDEPTAEFRIPERGAHRYQLLKGRFVEDLCCKMPPVVTRWAGFSGCGGVVREPGRNASLRVGAGR